MTAETDHAETEQESIASKEPHLFDGESAHGFVSGEAFFSPETAAVDIDTSGDGLVRITIREATIARGLVVSWGLPAEEAREFVDELAEAIDESEIEKS